MVFNVRIKSQFVYISGSHYIDLPNAEFYPIIGSTMKSCLQIENAYSCSMNLEFRSLLSHLYSETSKAEKRRIRQLKYPKNFKIKWIKPSYLLQ